jgi:replication factor C subunit 2/4
LLFYGPPGTGKTSTILAVAYELYGPPDASDGVYSNCVLELNASDERGIDVIRKKVKTFAQASVAAPSASSPYPCPPYKLIILDEADSMTSDAQHALRRTMETYSSVTRFCLLCNYVTRIIEPLTSRTAKFRFRPLKPELITKRLSEIATAEGLTNISEEILVKLNEMAQGDLRKAINYLQSSYRLYGTSLKPSHIDDMSGNVPADRMNKFLMRCRLSKSYKEIQDLTQDLINDGYPANQVLSQLHDLIVPLQDMTEVHKATVLTCLAEADKALIDGAGEFLQLLHVASTLMKAR